MKKILSNLLFLTLIINCILPAQNIKKTLIKKEILGEEKNIIISFQSEKEKYNIQDNFVKTITFPKKIKPDVLITIGSGTDNSSAFPIISAYNYSYSQQIYLQSQIASPGEIKNIRFYFSSGSSTNSNNWTVYLGHTAKTEFTTGTDWASYTSLTQVFSGVVSFPSTNNSWLDIAVTTPFEYNNIDNLVIAVDENAPGYTGNTYWGRYTSTKYAGLNYYSDLTNPNPESPPNSGTNRTQQPNRVQLEIEIVYPVNLLSFTSEVKCRCVKLKWVTSFEENNTGFEVQRINSINKNSEWEKIGFVHGNGSSNTLINYSFEDKNLTTGKYQYRLKQFDYNGNFEYHTLDGIVEVGIPAKFDLSQNYPNPFNPVTKINFDLPKAGQVSLKVFDILGKEVKTLVNEFKDAGYYNITFDASGLPSGVYFCRISAGEYSSVKKLVLMK